MANPKPRLPAWLANAYEDSEHAERRRRLFKEFRRRWQQGERPDAREFLDEFPELWQVRGDALDLIYDEYRFRVEAGEKVDPEEFCRRFPDAQSSVRRMVHVGSFLQNHPQFFDELPLWPEEGDQFLGFRLLQELGSGSFARVFLAHELDLGDRLVVVKVSADGSAEAATLGRLDHPHIVPIHSVRHSPEARLSLVCMPYCGRATLHYLLDLVLKQGRVPERADAVLQAAHDPHLGQEGPGRHLRPDPLLRRGTYETGVLLLGAQLAEALAFVHGRGVLHRDLKPSNVLLCPDGRPMLLDFNLSADVRLPDSQIGGTLPYMSPEQVLATDTERGVDPSLLDGRSDVYSLGVLLYELLTGHHPFTAPPKPGEEKAYRKNLLDRQRAGPVPLPERNPRLDRYAARLVESCLAYNPNDRPRSADELARGLRRGVGLIRRSRRWWMQNKRRALAAAAAAVVVVPPAVYAVVPKGEYYHREWRAGVQDYRAGRYDAALHHCDQSLRANPGHAPTRYTRGLIFVRLSRAATERGDQDAAASHLDMALRDFAEVCRLAPVGPSYAWRAYCLTQRRMFRDAVASGQEALRYGPESAALWNNLAYAQLKVDDFKGAEFSVARALQLHPNLPEAFHLRLLQDSRRLQLHAQYLPALSLEEVRAAFSAAPPSTALVRDATIWCTLAGKRQTTFTAEAANYLPPPSPVVLPVSNLVSALSRSAALSRFNPWERQALDCLKLAPHLGLDLSALARQRLFLDLARHPEFRQLQAQPVAVRPTGDEMPLVAPTSDLPE